MAETVDEHEVELIKRLVDRLERLSADSTYAHRASGLRGSLLRFVEQIDTDGKVDRTELDQLVEYGYMLLQEAAKEIGDSK